MIIARLIMLIVMKRFVLFVLNMENFGKLLMTI